MPASKNRKDHNRKVENRNNRIKQEKARINKLQKEWLTKLIEQEQEKGLFENTKKIDSIDTNQEINLE